MQTTLPLHIVLIESVDMFLPSEKDKGCKEEPEFVPDVSLDQRKAEQVVCS